MKFIGLFLSLTLVLLCSYESVTFVMSMEKSSQKTIECSFEKKQSENFSDETKLVFSDMSNSLLMDESIDIFQNPFYIFTITNSLFRPPIYA